MKRLITFLIVSLILCLSYIVYGLFTSNTKVEQPKIEMSINISRLTEKDYESVGTSELINPSKEDFRNIEFTLRVTHSNKITERNIVVPDLKKIANSYDDIKRYWYGNSASQDNPNENFAIYTYNFMFYSKGMDDQQIKDIFSTANVKVSWAVDSGEKVMNLGDYLHFLN